MTTEEKILEMLVEMRVEMNARFAQLEAAQARQGELLEELDERSLRSAVMLENQVLPQIQLLYEGQVNLQQTLAPKERVEVLEDEMITVKSMLKSLSNRLATLEKAQ